MLVIDEPDHEEHGLMTEAEFYHMGGALWKACLKNGLNVLGHVREAVRLTMYLQTETLEGQGVNGSTPAVSAVAVD